VNKYFICKRNPDFKDYIIRLNHIYKCSLAVGTCIFQCYQCHSSHRKWRAQFFESSSALFFSFW